MPFEFIFWLVTVLAHNSPLHIYIVFNYIFEWHQRIFEALSRTVNTMWARRGGKR